MVPFIYNVLYGSNSQTQRFVVTLPARILRKGESPQIAGLQIVGAGSALLGFHTLPVC